MSSRIYSGYSIIIDKGRHYTHMLAENDDEIDIATNKAFPDMGDTYISFWYAIKDKQFVIKEGNYFSMNDKAADYLKSKGIVGEKDNTFGQVRCEINQKIDYTGRIIIFDGRERDYRITGQMLLEVDDWQPDFDHPWWAYEEAKEYIIEHGNVIKCIDQSDFVSKFRREITRSNTFEVKMMIDPRFIQQIKECEYNKQYWWLNKIINLKNNKIHDLYYPYQDKYYGFLYRAYIANESDVKIESIINEFEYLSSIDTSEVKTSREDIEILLNTKTKQRIMYTLLKHARGMVSVEGFFEAMKLINELY